MAAEMKNSLEILKDKETLKNREIRGPAKEGQHQNYKNFRNKKQRKWVWGEWSVATKFPLIPELKIINCQLERVLCIPQHNG